MIKLRKLKKLKKLKKKDKRKVVKIIKWILFYLTIFLTLVIIFSTNWALVNCQFDNFDQILFTLNSSVSTASDDLINDFLINNILLPFIICGIITGIILLIKKSFVFLEVFIKIKIRKKYFKINFYTVISLVTLLSFLSYAIYYASSNLYILTYIENSYIESNFFEVNYVDPEKVELEFPEKKRNLIYIFSESMETTFADKENGGAYDINYMEDLVDLAKDNINFSPNNLVGGAYTAYNTSWTMAAMIAQTAGIPLKTNFAQNDEKSYIDGTLVPGAYSLGDILEDASYNQYIMVGSDLSFGGRRVYFNTHGNYTVFDYYTAQDEGIIDEDYYVNWGYEDEKLFNYAKDKLKEIAKSDEPFNFTLLTADTHFPDGYVSKSCPNTYDNHYLTSVDCSSNQLNDFINWIKKQDFYKNTTIVLVGDHLSMNTYSFDEVDPNYQRGVYNVFINSAVNTSCNKNRNFTTFDFFPTTLAALGVKIDGEKLGLGTNLFSCDSTLSEEYGNDYIDDRLMEKSLYYDECIN